MKSHFDHRDRTDVIRRLCSSAVSILNLCVRLCVFSHLRGLGERPTPVTLYYNICGRRFLGTGLVVTLGLVLRGVGLAKLHAESCVFQVLCPMRVAFSCMGPVIKKLYIFSACRDITRVEEPRKYRSLCGLFYRSLNHSCESFGERLVVARPDPTGGMKHNNYVINI